MYRQSLFRRFQAKMGDLPDVRPPTFHLLYNSVSQWKHTTTTIDCMYNNIPMHAAAYLLWSRHKDKTDGFSGAFIDNNTNHALPRIEAEVANKEKHSGLEFENIKYVIITHIHLDHAGATGALLQKCPNAVVVCHPRCVRHLVDPSYLIKAVKDVYGELKYTEMYGEILPCPADRIRPVSDGESLDLVPERPLQFFHVDGHAKHHMVIHDKTTNSVFTGDAMGIRYPWLELYNVRETFCFPSSSPTDFDAKQQRVAVEKIAALNPRKLYLTHYGMCEDIKSCKEQMLAGLDVYEALQVELFERLKLGREDEGAVLTYGTERMLGWMKDEMSRRGLMNDDEEFWNFFRSESELNAQGILIAAKRGLKK